MVYIEKIKDSLLKCNCISLEPLLDAGLSKKLFMIKVRRIIRICDEHFSFTKIWHDNSNVNGNKLRLYRNFKKDLVPEHYVLNYVPRHLRSYICKLSDRNWLIQ